MVSVVNIKNKFEVLLNLGTDKVDSDKRSYVKLSNANGVMYFFLDVFLAIILYPMLGDAHISIGMLCSATAFVIGSVGFNSMGWTTLSRLSTVSIGSILIAYCSFYLGSDSYTSTTMLLGAIFPFVYFSVEEKRSIAICIAVPIICYMVLIFNNYHWGPQIVITGEHTVLYLRIMFFMIPLAGIVGNTYAAVSEREAKSKNLLESQKVLETIFSALSHDLANPLQNICVIAEMGEMAGGIKEDKLKKLNRNAEQTMRVFKKLRSVTQTSLNGKLNMELRRCSVEGLIEQAVSTVKDRAADKKIEIESDLLALIFNPPFVMVDEEVFVFQILTNFLTNAVKFSQPGGKVNILVKIEDQSLKIIIRDWGQGIEAEKVEKLFSWTEKTSSVGTRGEKGTGLGLPLAYNFLKAMNADLKLKSYHHSQFDEKSRGTEITISLPVVKEVVGSDDSSRVAS